MSPVQHLLIVEDSERLARTLEDTLGPRVSRVSWAADLASARAVLEGDPPDAVLLDVALPDGEGLDLLDAIRALSPPPRVIAISGSASPQQAFRLAEAGVRAFLSKPLRLEELEQVWTRTLSSPPELTPHLRAQVGDRPLHELEAYVRDTLVDEAMARSTGSIRGAAKVLGISRQLLQQILRKRQPDRG